MIATPSRLCLEDRPTAQAISEHCPATVRRASVLGVGGTDAVLAARLAAGDDHALEEIFDTLARVVYGSALRVLGDDRRPGRCTGRVRRAVGSSRPLRSAAGTLRTYLAVLARHRAVDMVRSELRRVARQERSYRLMPAPPSAGPAIR